MYCIRSNDGDRWDGLTLEEVGEVIVERLTESAEEEATKRWCSYEVYWRDDGAYGRNTTTSHI